MKRMILALAAPLLLAVAAAYAADVKLDGIKCVVGGSIPAKADKSVDYKGGKVYFCCANCPTTFSKNTTKFAAQANHQLVATGQAVQEKCPISGGPVSADQSVMISGVKVAFCCDGCKGKVANAEAAKQLELCFADKVFDANFKIKK